MTRAFVLMTAMPPTIGHLHLIEFASELADNVTVIVSTQPGEPYPVKRFAAVKRAVENARLGNVAVRFMHRQIEQNPEAPGFWEMWDKFMWKYGFTGGDMVVSSEPYGATLASRLGGTFMPYDPNRQLYYTKATKIREDPGTYFKDILPEFQKFMVQTVTFFGAESNGKTTTSHELSKVLNGHWLFEYARPYLETVGTDITVESMTAIWKGQAAIQKNARNWTGKPFVIQDTDLFSTIGYWAQPHWRKQLGSVPADLITEACELKSDLYIILKSTIPFELDPIRYGGGVRENTDDYWLELAEAYKLNYVVVDEPEWFERLSQSRKAIETLWEEKASTLWYDRGGI